MKIVVAQFALLLIAPAVRAEFLQMDLSIFGMDWMTCAFAVRGALKKYPGVESVEVSLKQGLATVKLKPGNTVRPEEFWGTIRRNGFTPKETRVVVRGTVRLSPQPQLTVSGTNEVFPLRGDDRVLREAAQQDNRSVIVEGNLVPDKNLKAASFDARAIRPAE